MFFNNCCGFKCHCRCKHESNHSCNNDYTKDNCRQHKCDCDKSNKNDCDKQEKCCHIRYERNCYWDDKNNNYGNTNDDCDNYFDNQSSYCKCNHLGNYNQSYYDNNYLN